jgi:hypothetical protein
MPGAEDGDQMLVFFAIFSVAMVAREERKFNRTPEEYASF